MALGGNVIRQDVCDDSMAWARKHIHTAPHGTLFVADKLTRAKGQYDRVWELREGQITLTLLLKPTKTNHLEILNMAIALGIAGALGQDIRLKKPNDFIANKKKLGGMLIEVVWTGKKLDGIILGVGLNINNTFAKQDPLGEIATSLREVTGERYDIAELQDEILESLDYFYHRWQSGDHKAIEQAYYNQLVTR